MMIIIIITLGSQYPEESKNVKKPV